MLAQQERPKLHVGKPWRSDSRSALIPGAAISCMIASEECAEFHEAIDQQAKPEIHHSAQIEGLRTVLRCGRQVRRQCKIQGVTEQDRDQILH